MTSDHLSSPVPLVVAASPINSRSPNRARARNAPICTSASASPSAVTTPWCPRLRTRTWSPNLRGRSGSDSETADRRAGCSILSSSSCALCFSVWISSKGCRARASSARSLPISPRSDSNSFCACSRAFSSIWRRSSSIFSSLPASSAFKVCADRWDSSARPRACRVRSRSW